jgi:uncharacterized protein YkwD
MALRGARLALIVLAATMAACSAPSSPDRETEGTSGSLVPDAAKPLVEITNAERKAAGLTTLRVSTRLTHAAQRHAEQMAAAGRLAHTLPEGRYPRMQDRLAGVEYRWQAAAENIAAGQPGAAAVVETWMQSAAHRANILNATFTEIGTGTTRDATGRRYYVQVLARPRP